MNKVEMMNKLNEMGLKPIAKTDTKNLMLTKKLIRSENNSLAAIGNDYGKDEQIHAVIDALHWHIQTKNINEELKIVFGELKDQIEMDEVKNAVAILIESMLKPIKVKLEVNFSPAIFNTQEFDINLNWMSYLQDPKLLVDPPRMALSLSDMVKEDSFRWYRHLTKGYWSGRVEGLQVCVVYPENKKGWFGIGSPGKLGNSKARKAFLEIAGENEGYFYENEISSIASLIKQLAKSRKTGKLRRVQTEHFIESKILRKKINVYINEDILSPVCRDYPFQFPTLWSPSGNTRFLDLLMKIGKIPWAIELKDKTKGQGLAYRHAITQAVLYREFIKRSKKLHTWFEMQGLDAKKCKSGVVFPKMKSNKKQQMVLQHHKQIGDVFGVEILEIDF